MWHNSCLIKAFKWNFIHINGNLCYINYFIYFIGSQGAHLLEDGGYTPVHPAVSGGCLIGRWIIEWWDRGEDISLRDPWRRLVDESVQTTTAKTILREIWYLHRPMLSLQRDNLTSFVLISFHFRRSWHKRYLCHIGGNTWTIPPRVLAFWQVITLQYLKSSVSHFLFIVTLLKGEINFCLCCRELLVGSCAILTVYKLYIFK